MVKDPLGTKGARLTTDITLPSRYLVFMPENSHVGVSQRIVSEEERVRLKALDKPACDELGGFIIRTATEGANEEELRQDAELLKRLWRIVVERKSKYPTKSKIYSEPALAQRILRDFIGTNIERIRIDSKLCYGEVKESTVQFMHELSDKLVLYSGNQPIFDVYGVENAIQTAVDKRVNLKSGGNLIIKQTEAMTTIDINTGAFVAHRNLEETIFNTNIEATKAIAKQLQLRNLAGIIIIDFIDMQTDEHRNQVLQSLCDALSKDRMKTNVNSFTQLGLVEMNRKRTRESLEHVLCDECPTCHGRGRVKTVETVCYEIMREIIRMYHLFSSEQFVIDASPAVSEYLINEESHGLLPEVEMFIGKRVIVKTEQFYNQQQFEVVVM